MQTQTLIALALLVVSIIVSIIAARRDFRRSYGNKEANPRYQDANGIFAPRAFIRDKIVGAVLALVASAVLWWFVPGLSVWVVVLPALVYFVASSYRNFKSAATWR